MINMLNENIFKRLVHQNVKLLKVLFVDINGELKSVFIPDNCFKRALQNELMIDGSSICGFSSIDKADLYLKVDSKSLKIIENKNEAYIFSYVCKSNGENYECDSRYVLKKQIDDYWENHKFIFNVGFEPEFYILKKQNGDLIPIDDKNYFDLSELSSKIRCEISDEFNKLGYKVGPNHHEVGHGQNEVNYEYMEAMAAADAILIFKQVAKIVGERNGCIVSFMPKIYSDLPGNGLHLNCSITSDGENLFGGKESEYRRYFVNGLLKHSKSLMALTNSTINSYKRTSSGGEAPQYAFSSLANRKAMIRIPDAKGDKARIEIRTVDALCNPYLTIACIMALGLNGINNKESFDLNKTKLPNSLEESLRYFSRDKLIKETCKERLFKKYIEIKRREIIDFNNQITEYELERYLNK